MAGRGWDIGTRPVVLNALSQGVRADVKALPSKI